MDAKPFHTCNAAGLAFPTINEWSAYCKQHRDSGEPVAENDGFRWNIHDVCLNPHITAIVSSDNAAFEIETAQRPDKTWVYGWHYSGIMTEPSNGGGSPVMFCGKNFPTEDEAIKDGCKLMLQNDNLAPKWRTIIQTELNQRRVVQLTLF